MSISGDHLVRGGSRTVRFVFTLRTAGTGRRVNFFPPPNPNLWCLFVCFFLRSETRKLKLEQKPGVGGKKL